MRFAWIFQPDVLPFVALAATTYTIALAVGIRANLYRVPGTRLTRGLLLASFVAMTLCALTLTGALLMGTDLSPVLARGPLTLTPTHWLAEIVDIAAVAALLGSVVFPLHAFVTSVEALRHLRARLLFRDGHSAERVKRILRDRSPFLGPLAVTLLSALPLGMLWGDPRFFLYGAGTAWLVFFSLWLAAQPTAAVATIHPSLRQTLGSEGLGG